MRKRLHCIHTADKGNGPCSSNLDQRLVTRECLHKAAQRWLTNTCKCVYCLESYLFLVTNESLYKVRNCYFTYVDQRRLHGRKVERGRNSIFARMIQIAYEHTYSFCSSQISKQVHSENPTMSDRPFSFCLRIPYDLDEGFNHLSPLLVGLFSYLSKPGLSVPSSLGAWSLNYIFAPYRSHTSEQSSYL